MSAPQTNVLLDVLSPASRELIFAEATEVALPMRHSLQAQEERPPNVYFITRGVASVVVGHAEGLSAETMLIGREGLTGALSLLGSALPPMQCFMQVPGDALQVPLPRMQELFRTSEEIRSRVLECVQQQALTTTQIAACNVAHDAEARLARWLLMVQDRTAEETFQLTQEFLSEMLGARRTTVALAAGSLQRSGLIRYTRGQITVESREDLEGAACECYAVVRRLWEDMYR